MAVVPNEGNWEELHFKETGNSFQSVILALNSLAKNLENHFFSFMDILILKHHTAFMLVGKL